jgi:hypothetical protein
MFLARPFFEIGIWLSADLREIFTAFESRVVCETYVSRYFIISVVIGELTEFFAIGVKYLI